MPGLWSTGIPQGHLALCPPSRYSLHLLKLVGSQIGAYQFLWANNYYFCVPKAATYCVQSANLFWHSNPKPGKLSRDKMRAKRVVLLSNRSLLSAGVRRLLQGVDSLELSIVAAEDPEASPKLRELAPEVIILDSDDPSLGEGIITHLLGQHPKARVIALKLDRKGIEVYMMHRCVETDLFGLLEAIRGRRHPRNKVQPLKGPI
ncbi:MAG: hypothetical protein HY664_05610 [Chloroflexi bacterium]|nr:hypothetical protein [Chloroflexota bacterium]